MSKRKKSRFVDLSPFFAGVDVKDIDGVYKVPHLCKMKPFTITGTWHDPNTVSCGVCGERFRPGEEGTPILADESTGFSTAACPTCVVALGEEDK